jgi:hypothetical protein
MTEAEWQACEDLAALLKAGRPALKGRKKQLLFVAFARRVGRFLADPRSLHGLEVLERYLDGQAGARELKAARAASVAASREAEERYQASHREFDAAVTAAGLPAQAIWMINFMYPVDDPRLLSLMLGNFRACAASQAAMAACAAMFANSAAYRLLDPIHIAANRAACADGQPRDYFAWQNESEAVQRAEDRVLCCLVRDVVGPRKPAPQFDPAWRGPTARLLAQAAHEEREMPSGELEVARLMVLADALEEAGCTNGDILSHLRSPGPHVRGCWALGLILNKQ